MSTETMSVSRKYRKRSKLGEIWHHLKKNKGAMTGLGILIVMFAVALTIDFWLDMEKVIGQNISQKLQAPNSLHWFGTDEMGRDMFWRVVYGSRYSLAIGFVAVMVSLAVGVPLGAVAGYYGGKVEGLIMRITDIFSAIPSILMGVVIVSILGSSTFNLMLAVGISSVPNFVRITRAAVLTVKNEEYVEAARALGKTDLYIIFRHILPNCLSPIIVQTTLRVASAIVSASSLSFLGLGIKPPSPEWGALLTAGKTYIRGYSYLCLFPGLAIMITVLAFNMVGDGLRDAMDPKLKR
ncbi:MAG: ABC transporter permease [Lachnospiraceae bacterium]|jgi:peptide/nickel transport system permease protein|nr:ABC transporter permease [Lachnospiraceae bacterium]